MHGYPLATPVDLYPEKAHRPMAARLGLEYDEIKRFIDRTTALQQRSSGPGKKGADVSEAQASWYRKRTKFKEAPSEEVTDVTSPDRIVHKSPSYPHQYPSGCKAARKRHSWNSMSWLSRYRSVGSTKRPSSRNDKHKSTRNDPYTPCTRF